MMHGMGCVKPRLLALGAWDGFEARRDEARASGRLRGISIGNYIDLSTGAPVERSEIEIWECSMAFAVAKMPGEGNTEETHERFPLARGLRRAQADFNSAIPFVSVSR